MPFSPDCMDSLTPRKVCMYVSIADTDTHTLTDGVYLSYACVLKQSSQFTYVFTDKKYHNITMVLFAHCTIIMFFVP